MNYRLLIIFIAISFYSLGQKEAHRLSGSIIDSDGRAIVGAQIYFENNTNLGSVSDIDGTFEITDLTEGHYELKVSALGFKTYTQFLEIKGESKFLKVVLKEDVLNLEQIVVTGSRKKVPIHKSPIIITTITDKTFERTQSLSLAEGLSFSPGLRLENNCQNCGFTQVRMNGLEGAYSQILINSRPVFSALAGVYGLEMLPASMIDRVEVVRGGGSALYGGNAIAGTINVITKDPVENTFELGYNHAVIGDGANDGTFNLNGSIVSDDLKKGISFYGFKRKREHWDANGDGFSEITSLENNTFGFDGFWNLNKRTKLKLGGFIIDEFRRGGSDFNLEPHQSAVAEQLDHQIGSVNASFERYSVDQKHKFSVYSSAQWVDRGSYYGGGGRVLNEGDSLTETDILALNAYGQSNDLSLNNGLQYVYNHSKKWLFMVGSEVQYNTVTDQIPGYERSIEQGVTTLGNYLQVEWNPLKKLSFLAGGRYDIVDINGEYTFADDVFQNEKQMGVFVPRISAMYTIVKGLKSRFSYAQGYRAPQAFDEDLHIETVGGAARFIQIDPSLDVENSDSYTVSLNYDKIWENFQLNLVAEGFYTLLKNPFILSNQEELPNGVAVITKRNGAGAFVKGINFELNMAYKSKLILQSGITLQQAIYSEEEVIWEPDENTSLSAVTSDRILRTPNTYGFFNLTYTPLKQLSLSYSGMITGSMLVPHIVNVENEFTVLEETPAFFDSNIKIQYDFETKKKFRISIYGGIQNILNSYQSDFDTGTDRDAGYVYGPSNPRTFFLGLKLGLN